MGILKQLFGRKQPPPLCPGNPGHTTSGRIGLARGDQTWSESFELVSALAQLLRERGHTVVEHGTWIELSPSGFVLQPRLVETQPLEDTGVQTATTIDVHHPNLIPNGVFEYQHATGDTVAASLREGFSNWEELDLSVFLDAVRAEPKTCACIEMPFPAADGKPARTRRAVLGNIQVIASTAADEATCDHPFCTCCFLTNNFKAFEPHVKGDSNLAIRFYAARDKNGQASADCRINGEDFEPGKASLRQYIATWPGIGVEFRKQYVFVHTLG